MFKFNELKTAITDADLPQISDILAEHPEFLDSIDAVGSTLLQLKMRMHRHSIS